MTQLHKTHFWMLIVLSILIVPFSACKSGSAKTLTATTIQAGSSDNDGDFYMKDLTLKKWTMLASYIEDHHRRHGRLPEHLSDLTFGDYSDAVKSDCCRDAWGNPTRYEIISERSYRLSSLGADGKSGGEGEDADFANVNNV